MDFLPFPKITTESQCGFSNMSGAYVAQEKIHGAQLVIAVSPLGVKFGKRKAWLNDQEAFFGWQLIKIELKSLCEKIYRSQNFPNGTIVYFYGELFGGQYPHPSVSPIEGIQPIQTGIWYSPFIHWMVFDAVVLPSGIIKDAYFLGTKELSKATNEAGGLCPPLLAKGSLNDLLTLPVRFQTKISKNLNLPEIKDNWAEGLIIKSENSVPISKRSIINRKIEEFDEKRFDESKSWESEKILSLEGLKAWAVKMVNPARLASARSKIGNNRNNDFFEEVFQDIMLDLEAAFPLTFQSLTSEQESTLRDHVFFLIENI